MRQAPGSAAMRSCRRLTDVGKVRRRLSTDLVSCVNALSLVHAADAYPTNWPQAPEAWLDPAGLLAAWVGVDPVDGQVDGHVAVVHADPGTHFGDARSLVGGRVAELSRLFVLPAARGRGLATSLLTTAANYAALSDLSLVLEVVDEPGSAAIALYEACDWRQAGERRADWTTPDGRHPALLTYVAPDGTSDTR